MRALLLSALLSVLAVAGALELTFFEVGQGLSVLVRSPSGQVVLYDAGPASANVADRLQREGVDRIDLAIASHAHADHIGGMAEVLRTFRPPNYLDNGLSHTTATYERTLRAASEVDVALLEPERRRIGLGEVTLRVLPPPGRASWGHNDNSVGLVIEYGDFRATLPGDAEPDQWGWWRTHHDDLVAPSEVHAASHHGSRNGDVRPALRQLAPGVVVVSAGRDNRYGHPHAEALRMYAGFGAEVYRTDVHGRVHIDVDADGSYQVTAAREGPTAPGVGADGGPAEASEPDAVDASCVDVNSAPPDRLTEILHIGPSRAEDVVRARRQRPFERLSGLTRVDGIAEGRLSDIREEGVACVR